MFSKRNLYLLFVVVFVLTVFSVGAVIAQDDDDPIAVETVSTKTVEVDGVPFEIPVIYVDNDDKLMLFMGGVLLIALAVIAVLGGSIRALYLSLPPWARAVATPMIQTGTERFAKLIAATSTEIDDAVWAEIEPRIKAILADAAKPPTNKTDTIPTGG